MWIFHKSNLEYTFKNDKNAIHLNSKIYYDDNINKKTIN